jgi:hypothetical protein
MLQGMLNVVGCWRLSLAGHPRPLVCRLKISALNRRKTANADGGPAADDFEKSLKQLVAEQKLAGRQGRKPKPESNFKE